MSDETPDIFRLAPAARRVVREIRRQVLANQICSGTALPTVRSLASRSGLSAFPVQQALKHIEREGWARRQSDKGRLHLVVGALERARAGLQYEPPLVIDIAAPLHHVQSYEHHTSSLGRRMAAFFDQCSTRQVLIDLAKGPEGLAQVLDENERIPNEVAYVLTSMPSSYQSLLEARDLPCVVPGYVDPAINLPSVYEDMNRVGYMVGKVLCPGGRVVVLHFGDLVGAEVNIIDGARWAAREVGVSEPRWEEFYVSVAENVTECEARIDQLFSIERRPEGILAMRPEIAMLVLRCALRRGMQIPQDLQLIGYGSPKEPMYELSYPGITSVGPKSDDDLARCCAELLTKSLGQRPKVAPRELLQSALVERQTTRGRQAAQ